MDDSRGWPSTNSVGWVKRFEPSNHSSWVTTTSDDPARISAKLDINHLYERSNICKSLLWCQILEIISRPIIKWLWCSIVSVLKTHKKSIMLYANHHWIAAYAWCWASPLSTDIEENWPLILIEIRIVNPISLWISTLIFSIEMVQFVLENTLDSLFLGLPQLLVTFFWDTSLHCQDFHWILVNVGRSNSCKSCNE